MFRPLALLATLVARWLLLLSTIQVVTSSYVRYTSRLNWAIDSRGLSPHKTRGLVGRIIKRVHNFSLNNLLPQHSHQEISQKLGKYHWKCFVKITLVQLVWLIGTPFTLVLITQTSVTFLTLLLHIQPLLLL